MKKLILILLVALSVSVAAEIDASVFDLRRGADPNKVIVTGTTNFYQSPSVKEALSLKANYLDLIRNLNCNGRALKGVKEFGECEQAKSALLEYPFSLPTNCEPEISNEKLALLLSAQIKYESGFNPNAGSPKGAVGISQFLLESGWDWNVYDRHDISQSIRGQTNYMRWLLKRYGCKIETALAGYNWGQGNVDKSSGQFPAETRKYISGVLGEYNRLQGLA